MLSNVGHTIQKMINNTPVAITANDSTTAVATNGGNVYQAGFIANGIRNSFHEIAASGNVGHIIDAEATEDSLYLLNAAGSVFQYDYNACDCPIIREVYSPAACGGDKAIKIDTGRAHVLILTENNKVWGAGNNEEYQLVPQGQCRYDTAVEVIVTDTNLHDNDCCNAFTGTYNELESPVIPSCQEECNKIACVKKNLCDKLLGYVNVCQAILTPPGCPGILSIPVYGDLNYVGFLCIDQNGCASGSVTYSITRLYIKCGCFLAKFTTNDSCGCHIREFNVSSTTELLLFEADLCQSAKTDLCGSITSPITGTAQINGKCGTCVVANIDLPHDFCLPEVAFDFDCKTILLEFKKCRSSLTALCDSTFCGLSCEHNVDIDLDFDVPLKCCEPFQKTKQEVQLPQPCWAGIYAGFDISVLVDSCNRIYVFGSLYKVRSNKDLLKRSCLEELLNKTNASISFPADQLNCGNHSVRNNVCGCNACKDKQFKTDLSKFGISLNFPQGHDECDKNMNVCDFLQSLKRCNESTGCGPTCEPCDGYIYLNVSGNCGCPCGAPVSNPIGSITLFNKRSICKLVSQGCPDLVKVDTDLNTIVEFDLNKYCIDTTDISLDKIVKLNFCNDGPNVNLYIDIDQPGGIKFIADGKKCNVEFTVSASTENHQFLLNFGSILDPVELTNLKYALSLDCFFPCPRFKNPFDTKITNTYIRGGDHIKFVTTNPKNIRQAVTPDIPTVFRLNRRVLDVAVGNNNLTVLVGGLACPNEIFAIGSNCYGELGLGTNESIVCWRQLNRCIFDCQVVRVFAGNHVTFYATQSNHIYGAGQWKCLVNSNSPVIVKSICQSWKIKQMAITKTHIVMLGSDGCIFGVGDNSLGELGLCHTDCVKKPVPLVFFYRLNNKAAEQLKYGLSCPIRHGGPDNCWKPKKQGCPNDPCPKEKKPKCYPQQCYPQPCAPCGPICPPCPPCNPCGPAPCGPTPCGDLGYDGYGCGDRPHKYPKYGPYKKYSPNGRVYGNKYGKY